MRPTSPLVPGRGALVAFALLLSACRLDAEREEPTTARVSAAIVAGRVSGDEENAAVYLETRSSDVAGQVLRCTGRIIAPGLVVTARHCLLKRGSLDLACNPDGSSQDPADTSDVRVEAAEQMSVFLGAKKPDVREVKVKQVITYEGVTVCRSDIGFLVLAERGLETRTPLRRAPPTYGEKVSVTGWGFNSNDRTALPLERSTVETKVVETTSDRIPPGTFVVPGRTLCFGDSGSSVLAGGAVVGVYSRIEAPQDCLLEEGRNVVTEIAPHTDLIAQAFAAIGEAPAYADEPATCDGGECASVALPADAGGSGCAMAAPRSAGDASVGGGLALAALLVRRRRPQRRH